MEFCISVILPVVLHKCETWLLTRRENCRLSGFENMMLRKIFGSDDDDDDDDIFVNCNWINTR